MAIMDLFFPPKPIVRPSQSAPKPPLASKPAKR
jgi:hypothetical protein